MRKITRETATAFLKGRILYKDNTLVEIDGMYLFGNRIAYWNTDSSVAITLAGHNTPTTRERLNGLLELMKSDNRIHVWKGTPRLIIKNPEFLDGYGWDMNPYEEYTIEYGFGSKSRFSTTEILNHAQGCAHN